MYWYFRLKQKQKLKNHHFCRFCPKTYVFVANNVLIFSDLRIYRANHTPPPPVFCTHRVGQLSSENFLFFYFLFFVKYYDFAYSAFLPNFENFWEYHIYFSFCIKFHSIYFCLFLWLLWRFMYHYGIIYHQIILNVLELNYRAFCINYRFCVKMR